MRTQVTDKHENKVVPQFSTENKALFIPKNVEAVKGFETIALEAETLHSCQKIDYVE